MKCKDCTYRCGWLQASLIMQFNWLIRNPWIENVWKNGEGFLCLKTKLWCNYMNRKGGYNDVHNPGECRYFQRKWWKFWIKDSKGIK